MRFHSQRRAVSLLLAAAFALDAGGAEPKEQPKLPPEIEQVFGIALAAPPEFAAAALVRVASRAPGKAARRDLIDMAFHLAAKAQNPVRLISVATDADTRSAYLGSALLLNLDALTLQSRAIQDLVAVDPVRARELFAELTRPSPAPATCEESLLPDVSPFYEALTGITRSTFSPKERARSEHVAFASAALSGMGRVADVAAAASMIAGLEWSREQFEIVAGAFTSRLVGIAPDSRSFQHFSGPIESAMAVLNSRAQALGAPSEPLAEAYRKFLVTQLRGPRCKDGAKPVAGLVVQSTGSNELFGDATRGQQAPLRAEEIKPEAVEGEMKLDRYWQSGDAQRIFQDCLKLRTGPTGALLPESARRTMEWTVQLTDVLNELANWRPIAEASEADFYHQKAIVYEAVLELAPPGDLSDRVIEGFTGFLKGSNLQQQNAVEWFWHARSTVDRVRPSHPEVAAKILASYRASGNIVLLLEAMLDQLAPVSPYFRAEAGQ